MENDPVSRLGRRKFLKRAGLVGAALPVASGMVVAACYEDPTGGKARPTPRSVATTPPSQNTPQSNATQTAQQLSDQIDSDHKAGIEKFLANQKSPITKGKGNQPLAPRMENGVKVWDLTVDDIEWETIPGKLEQARGFNGAIPGPILRGTQGDKVRINVKNNLKASTTVHWHGLVVPNSQDGVAYITQPEPIKPGQSQTYEFTLINYGSHMYHSHHDSTDQVNRGLLGAFIVDPKDPSVFPKYDREYILILNDSLLGFTINGKGFPATDALVAKKGERVLIRWMNEGMMYHPMHLHGMPMEVFAWDGYPHTPYKCDTIDVPPGNRYDCIVEATEVGIWAFHCHVLSHAENPSGFFGLTTVLIVQE